MNSKQVREIIKGYKRHFKSIHNEEIYKWRAVKCFQDNWNIHEPDFVSMLDKSFQLSKNLLDSGLYYPKQMLHEYTKKDSERVRHLFIELYNENNNLIERIISFQEGIREIHSKCFSDKKNDYQDKRAVLVYLCLRFPDLYYLYKYKMFKGFASLIDYPYQPKPGHIQNILEFLSLCSIIKAEIVKDHELLELHKTRIRNQEYLDNSYNILTQDIIYASVQHIDKFDKVEKQESALKRLIEVDTILSPKAETAVLKGSFTNYIENDKEKKRIGDLGELLVLQSEQEKLISLGIKKTPEHVAKSEGDGLGFDILSYDGNGHEIFIEVKTTTGPQQTPFFITRNELLKSTLESKNFFLYRLFDFNDTDNRAKYFIRNGDLSSLCTNPILYKSILEE